MPNRSEAEENLRVIRSLMEKATIYRALSAPAALLGGLLSLVVGILGEIVPLRVATGTYSFAGAWGTVCAITFAASLVLLKRDAERRGDTFVSSGFRAAMWAMLPALLCGGFIGARRLADGSVSGVALWWMIFYGLALLATAHFAPRSVARLGWLFVGAGLLVFTLPPDLLAGESGALQENRWMAATFGLFHLGYAACTWPRKAVGEA